jgi:hypothetical protein
MKTWAVYDSAGRINVFRCNHQTALLQVGPGLALHPTPVGEGVSDATHYFTGATVAPRPSLPAPAAAIAVGSELVLHPLPVGADWEIYDVTDPELPPALTDAKGFITLGRTLREVMEEPGRFRLDVSPPFPWRKGSWIVEVF